LGLQKLLLFFPCLLGSSQVGGLLTCYQRLVVLPFVGASVFCSWNSPVTKLHFFGSTG
jgi:hypothetical protein